MSGSKIEGFTLIELLVAMAIIAALLSIAAPRYLGNIDRSKSAVLRENLATIRDVIDKYYADNGAYPSSLNELVERRYLRRVPVDPYTESSGTWLIVPPQAPEQGNVFDVQSGAKGEARNGSAYKDW